MVTVGLAFSLNGLRLVGTPLGFALWFLVAALGSNSGDGQGPSRSTPASLAAAQAARQPGWETSVTAAVAAFVRVAQGHEPGLIVLVLPVAASLLGVAIGFLDVHAGRVELPPGFVAVLRRLRRG
jgi:hypothetical protein